MKIAIIGAGYVGLTSAAVLARFGHTVALVEKNREKVSLILSGKVPFYEPGLEALVRTGLKQKKLQVTNNCTDALRKTKAIFICVGTPLRADGGADLSQVFTAAKEIAKHLQSYAVVINKSTVPVGTTDEVKKIIAKNSSAHFDVASCPEFLREGTAVENTQNPDRIVIGVDSVRAKKILLAVHKKLPGKRVITDVRTAEIIKYASNAFLATKISFINEIANLCEEVSANVDDVALGMGLDPRIGKAFLKAGIGYGGSCFPKDTRALHFLAAENDYQFKLLKAVIEVNQLQRLKFIEKIKKTVGALRGKKIGVLGLAFKNNTDDVRESAAIEIIEELLKNGALIHAYDPKAAANAKRIIAPPRRHVVAAHKFVTVEKPELVADGASVILILTEWPEFRNLPWQNIKKIMKKPLILDGRNMLNPEKMEHMGFRYVSVGRSYHTIGLR